MPKLCSFPFSYQSRGLTDTFLMEKAAIHRIATSITQFTLCQVSMEEIEDATVLLEKASCQLRNVSEVVPQQITELERATRLASYATALPQQAMKSVKPKRHSCFCHAQRKALVLPLRNIMNCKPFQFTMTSCKSTSEDLPEIMRMLGKGQLSGL